MTPNAHLTKAGLKAKLRRLWKRYNALTQITPTKVKVGADIDACLDEFVRRDREKAKGQ